MMDIRRQRILFRLADAVIGLASIFLLLDAMVGFTGPRPALQAQSQPSGNIDSINSAHLYTSCMGGFANERTVGRVTQVAAHGTPFNAYQITLTNIGTTALTVRGVNVELTDTRNRIFTQHYTDLGNGAGIRLGLGQSRQLVEAYGIGHPVASCQILSWQP
jgi:hypothetical protein